MTASLAGLFDAYVAAWSRGDGEAAMAFWDDAIVLHAPGANPHAGTFRGKDAVRVGLIDRILAETSRVEILGVIDRAFGADHVFTIIHERFEKADGRVFETRRVVVYRWAGARIVEVRYFDPDQAAADVFWSAP